MTSSQNSLPGSLPPIAPPPALLKIANLITIVQAIAAVAVGIWLIVEDIRTLGQEDSLVSDSAASNWVGTGTAVFIFIVFGASAFVAITIMRGSSRGRGLIFLLQVLLLFVAFYMLTSGSSFWLAAGGALGLSALLILIGLLHPQSSEWFAEAYTRR